MTIRNYITHFGAIGLAVFVILLTACGEVQTGDAKSNAGPKTSEDNGHAESDFKTDQDSKSKLIANAIQSYRAVLESPGGDLPFQLEIHYLDATERTDAIAWAVITNGSEKIRVENVQWDVKSKAFKIPFDYYNSSIAGEIGADQELSGLWSKVTGKDKASSLKFRAELVEKGTGDQKGDSADSAETKSILGRWKVKFSSSEDDAVAIFSGSNGAVEGTFLTSTGDYRFLGGEFKDSQLTLSCFDGAHAFLFKAKLNDEKKLSGDFWSRDSWHETWTATKDKNASLPDPLGQTRWNAKVDLEKMVFPNLEGVKQSLNDPAFAGKARVLQIFGSWCPNCHDAAVYLSQLHEKYSDQGLSVVGLAFEMTGEFESDAKQVRRYIKRHNTKYPILIVGVADKKKATEQFGGVDKIRSYPTTIFMNSQGEIEKIYTGFSGPATGKDFEKLKEIYESTIEELLSE